MLVGTAFITSVARSHNRCDERRDRCITSVFGPSVCGGRDEYGPYRHLMSLKNLPLKARGMPLPCLNAPLMLFGRMGGAFPCGCPGSTTNLSSAYVNAYGKRPYHTT